MIGVKIKMWENGKIGYFKIGRCVKPYHPTGVLQVYWYWY